MNCTECKELFVEYVEGLLDESQKQAISEHLISCRNCKTTFDEFTDIQERLVSNSNKVKNSSIENKVIDRIVREQNVKIKTLGKEDFARKIRSKIMKSTFVKLAAAAIIIIAVLVGINPFKTSITLAQVVKPILNSRTIIFDLISGSDETGMVIHEIVVGSRIRRTMSNMPDMTMIIDIENTQLLSLDNVSKTAFYADIEGDLGNMTRSYIGFVRQIIGQFQDDQVEKLGEKIIDGQKAIGFRGKGQNEQVTIWADSQTAIPLRIEVHRGQEMAFMMKNFVFDVQVEESLVSMDIPSGYILKDAQMNLGNATEHDLIESLRIWATILGESVFPKAIDTGATMENMPVLIRKMQQMNIPEEEGTKMGINVGLGMLFQQKLDLSGNPWKYVGAGVKFGESQTPVFWYKAEGSVNYRVIYGDLHVEDVSADKVPQ
jgi:hypothetical protein